MLWFLPDRPGVALLENGQKYLIQIFEAFEESEMSSLLFKVLTGVVRTALERTSVCH